MNRFLYAYFHGDEQRVDDQQVYFAVGDDALHWRTLNAERPVLVSNVGDGGARDPFVLRTEQGFVLLATDLNIKNPRYAAADGTPNWRVSETDGSTNILLWRSADLVHWSDVELVDVAQGRPFGNVWAPKSTYVPQLNKYLLYWSSTVADDGYAGERIHACWTPDFRQFTEPFELLAADHSCIDANIVRSADDSCWLLYIKNESIKTVGVYEAGRLVADEGYPVPLAKLPRINHSMIDSLHGVEGPCITVRDDGTTVLYVDEYMGRRRGYMPFVSSCPQKPDTFAVLADGDYAMPPGARHGSILRITDEEYERLCDAYGVD